MADDAYITLDQIRSRLWAGEGARVHAVIDGARVPGLPARLAAAAPAPWDALQRGALDDAAAARAAYVVEVDGAAALAQWLLTQASLELPGWGVLLASTRTLLDVREHARALLALRLPDGSEREWRWFDPAVLDAFMAVASASQQRALLGPLRLLAAPGREAWTFYTATAGAVEAERRRLVAARS